MSDHQKRAEMFANEAEARIASRIGQLTMALVEAETARDMAQAELSALRPAHAALQAQLDELKPAD